MPRFNEANGFYTTKERSNLMSKIKSQDTKPEQKLRKFLWSRNLKYRKNVRQLPGKPDIAISKYKLVIFIDGEFWHGYNWTSKKTKIKTNRDFWIPKIERNIQRDCFNNEFYIENGWTVFRFWEHEINKEFNLCVNRLLEYIEDFKQLNVIETKNYAKLKKVWENKTN